MKIKHIIQSYLFKRRIILCAYNVKKETTVVSPEFTYKVLSQNDIMKNSSVLELLPKAINFHEIESESLFCLLYFDDKTDSIVGVGFLLVPRFEEIWYDNIILRPGEARLIGDYIYPAYRGKGIGSALNAERIRLAIQEFGVHYTTVIVETHRKAALNAQSKHSEQCGSNFLVKFFKRNIFSICIGNPYRGFWYVGPGRQRRCYVKQVKKYD